MPLLAVQKFCRAPLDYLFPRAAVVGAGARRREGTEVAMPAAGRARAASACRRQVVRCEELSSSRRRRAPIWPDSLKASTSCRRRNLYAAANRRRRGFSSTSEWGTSIGWQGRLGWPDSWQRPLHSGQVRAAHLTSVPGPLPPSPKGTSSSWVIGFTSSYSFPARQ
jgi:hypothetical protein